MPEPALNRFRKVAIWEGISFLLLLGIAMPIKYGLGIPEPVKVVGWAHGVLFIAYCILLVQAALACNWTLARTFLGFLASLLPFGPFIFDRKLSRELADTETADAPVK